MSYLRFLCRFAHSCVQHILTMRVPRLMSIRYRNCLLFVGAWVHPLVFDGVRCSSRPPGFIPWILMGSVALRGRLGLSPEFWWGPLLFAAAWVHPLVFDGVRFSSRPPGFTTWFLMGPVALRGRLCSSPGFWWGPLLFVAAWVHPLVFDGVRCSSRAPVFIPWFLMGSVLLTVLVFCVVLFFLFCVYSSRILHTKCCQFLWIVHSWLSLLFSLTFICMTLWSSFKFHSRFI